jgi:Tat protein secretion system quality control protein TatD with DNase activity
MFVDSHCHVDFPALASQMPDILQRMKTNQVDHALCVSVNLPDWPNLIWLNNIMSYGPRWVFILTMRTRLSLR